MRTLLPFKKGCELDFWCIEKDKDPQSTQSAKCKLLCSSSEQN